MIERAIPFTKMSGSGNDFVVIDDRANLLSGVDISGLARAICSHRISVGADGLVVLNDPPLDSSSLAYTWRYINADGSDGEMCGNGAMCAARFAVRSGIAAPHHHFLTVSGVVEAWAESASTEVSIAIADPGRIEAEVLVSVRESNLACTRIVVGVPHVVIIVDDADLFADANAFQAIGQELRWHDAFAPAGTNVNIVSRIAHDVWRMRTYERGVEAETLACGTGAVAAAIVLGVAGLAPVPMAIRTSGGQDLTVCCELDGGQASSVRLSGHAALIYDGVLADDALSTYDSSQNTRRNSPES